MDIKKEAKKYLVLINVFSALFGVLGFFQVWIPWPWSACVAWLGGVIFFSCLLSLAYPYLYRYLSHIHPWMALATMVIVVFVYANTNYRIRMIDLDSGGLYPDYEEEPNQPVYIAVWGSEEWNKHWFTDENRNEEPSVIGFNYKLNKSRSLPLDAQEKYSAGGFLLHYKDPVDRRDIKKFIFDIKISDNSNGIALCSKIDVGVRLALDDPQAHYKESERTAYEIKSLRKQYGDRILIDSSWNSIEMDIGDFRGSKSMPLVSKDISSYTVNKIVFFITPAMAKECPQAKLLFRNIGYKLKPLGK